MTTLYLRNRKEIQIAKRVLKAKGFRVKELPDRYIFNIANHFEPASPHRLMRELAEAIIRHREEMSWNRRPATPEWGYPGRSAWRKI